jgi:hypothetical protein
MIHLYTKYNLNPSNYHLENEREAVFIKSVTDGRRIGRTSPYHNTYRYNNWYETRQVAFGPKEGCIGKLDRYNDRKICEILTAQNLVASTFFFIKSPCRFKH